MLMVNTLLHHHRCRMGTTAAVSCSSGDGSSVFVAVLTKRFDGMQRWVLRCLFIFNIPLLLLSSVRAALLLRRVLLQRGRDLIFYGIGVMREAMGLSKYSLRLVGMFAKILVVLPQYWMITKSIR